MLRLSPDALMGDSACLQDWTVKVQMMDVMQSSSQDMKALRSFSQSNTSNESVHHQ